MNLSILSYSFRGLLNAGKMDVFGYLETSKYRYNLDAVDIWRSFFPSTDEDFLLKLRNGLDERNLTLVDLCVDGAHIWESKAEDLERNHARAMDFLEAAPKLGAKFVRIDAGGREETWSDEAKDPS